MSRTRFIDEVVVAYLGQGIRQVVILGAGLDTWAYRLPGMGGVKVYEVDLPGVQDEKRKRLIKHFGRLPEEVTFVPIDVETQTLEDIFAGTAFDPSEKAVFFIPSTQTTLGPHGVPGGGLCNVGCRFHLPETTKICWYPPPPIPPSQGSPGSPSPYQRSFAGRERSFRTAVHE